MKSANPLLVCRIGWMERYEGPDEIRGGGEYIDRHREGGEMWNFQKQNGLCRGYAMAPHHAGVDLGRLEKNRPWKKGEDMRADVVFIARHPKRGQVVVGWYKNATVFHRHYETDNHPGRYGYICTANENDATLLPSELRDFPVPRGKGFPGQSNIWYGDIDSDTVSKFKQELGEYINAPETLRARNNRRKTDAEEIFRIEEAAVSHVWEFYEKQGYTLKSVEQYGFGWDLEAVKNDEQLLLEVKGHKGGEFHFKLTPNEYEKMQVKQAQYRVCGVLHALTKPELKVFSPKKHNQKWRLIQEHGKGKGMTIELKERVSARAREIPAG